MTRAARDVRGGCEQLVGDAQGVRWIIAGKRGLCTRTRQAAVNGLHGVVWLECGVEEGFARVTSCCASRREQGTLTQYRSIARTDLPSKCVLARGVLLCASGCGR
jgi:hypothetical protein